MKMAKLIILRLRGKTGIKKEINDTFKMLNLLNKNHCVIVEDTPSYKGMVSKVKDYVTWGELSDETEKLLRTKRGKEGKKYFALQPPKGGFERKGIKNPYTIGGALGYRGDEINALIKKMI